MPIINRIADFYNDMKEWRQDLHSDPELKFECYRTAAPLSRTFRDFISL